MAQKLSPGWTTCTAAVSVDDEGATAGVEVLGEPDDGAGGRSKLAGCPAVSRRLTDFKFVRATGMALLLSAGLAAAVVEDCCPAAIVVVVVAIGVVVGMAGVRGGGAAGEPTEDLEVAVVGVWTRDKFWGVTSSFRIGSRFVDGVCGSAEDGARNKGADVVLVIDDETEAALGAEGVVVVGVVGVAVGVPDVSEVSGRTGQR
jgi:hypothetical protein